MTSFRDLITHPVTGETRRIPEGVIIREGQVSDLEAITELCKAVDFFDGSDFLPGSWVEAAQNQNRVLVVAEKDKKILAVTCTQVNNNGKHWVGYGARSHPSCREQNIYWACIAVKARIGVSHFAMPEKLLGAVADADRMLKQMAEGKAHSKVTSINKFICVCYKSSLQAFMPACDPKFFSKDIAAKVLMSPSELADIFANPSSRYDLFPSGHFGVAYSAYEAIPQSAYDIWSDDKQVAVVYIDGRPNSISFTTAFPCVIGTEVTVEIYGNPCNKEEILAHCQQQFLMVEKGMKKYGGVLTVFLFISQPSNMQPYVDLYHKELGFDDAGMGCMTNMGIYYNRPIWKPKL